MLTFKKYLQEALDRPYEFETGHARDMGEGSSLHTYRFKDHKGKQYYVNFMHRESQPDKAGLSFYDDKMNVHKTGTAGTKSIKIFSTVRHIIKQHVAKHPDLQRISFTSEKGSEGEQTSRSKLYKKFADLSGGQTEKGLEQDTHHIFPRKGKI